MGTIYRAVKGSKLTIVEGDDNLEWSSESGIKVKGSDLTFDRSGGWFTATQADPETGTITIDETVGISKAGVTGARPGTWNMFYYSGSSNPTFAGNSGTIIPYHTITTAGTYECWISYKGNGNYSLSIPQAGGSSATAPAAPTNFANGTATATTIPLTWTKSVTGVMTEYRVYNGATLLQTFTGDVALGTLTGLTPSTVYSNLSVRAFDGTLESSSSNLLNVTTAASSINAPTSLASGTATDTTIPLTWVKSTTGVMTEYRVYVGGTLQQTFVGDVALGTLTGLTASTAYIAITVRAFDGTNESGDSNSINVTTIAGGVDVYDNLNVASTNEVIDSIAQITDGFQTVIAVENTETLQGSQAIKIDSNNASSYSYLHVPSLDLGGIYDFKINHKSVLVPSVGREIRANAILGLVQQPAANLTLVHSPSQWREETFLGLISNGYQDFRFTILMKDIGADLFLDKFTCVKTGQLAVTGSNLFETNDAAGSSDTAVISAIWIGASGNSLPIVNNTDPHTGTNCVQCEKDVTSTIAINSFKWPAEASTVYKISAWIKVPTVIGGTINIQKSTNNMEPSSMRVEIAGLSTWTQVIFLAKTKAAITEGRIDIWLGSTADLGNIVLVDDIVIEKMV